MHHSGAKQTVSAMWVEHSVLLEFQLHPPNVSSKHIGKIWLDLCGATLREEETLGLGVTRCLGQHKYKQGKWDGRRTVESQLLPQDVSGQAQKKGKEGTITSNLTSNINGQVQNVGMGLIFSCIISSNSWWQSELSVIQDERNLRNSGKGNLRQVWTRSFQYCKIQMNIEEFSKSYYDINSFSFLLVTKWCLFNNSEWSWSVSVPSAAPQSWYRNATHSPHFFPDTNKYFNFNIKDGRKCF